MKLVTHRLGYNTGTSTKISNGCSWFYDDDESKRRIRVLKTGG
jgi:hypothetical protein